MHSDTPEKFSSDGIAPKENPQEPQAVSADTGATVKVKTADLIGAQLNWAVAKAEGFRMTKPKRGYSPNYAIVLVPNAISPFYECCVLYGRNMQSQYIPSRFPTQGADIIERERIAVIPELDGTWMATYTRGMYPGGELDCDDYWVGKTPLVAAMRAFVGHKLGKEVEVPVV